MSITADHALAAIAKQFAERATQTRVPLSALSDKEATAAFTGFLNSPETSMNLTQDHLTVYAALLQEAGEDLSQITEDEFLAGAEDYYSDPDKVASADEYIAEVVAAQEAEQAAALEEQNRQEQFQNGYIFGLGILQAADDVEKSASAAGAGAEAAKKGIGSRLADAARNHVERSKMKGTRQAFSEGGVTGVGKALWGGTHGARGEFASNAANAAGAAAGGYGAYRGGKAILNRRKGEGEKSASLEEQLEAEAQALAWEQLVHARAQQILGG